ncbi:hypothetical protein KAU45_05945 [bacterium]|nr:hypothetical protein [bacterium]
MDGIGFFIGGGVCLLIAVIGFFVLGAAKRKREDILGTETYSAGEIKDVYKTSKEEMLDGAFNFPCELKGTIGADRLLTAPLSRKRGVWYRSLVERQRQVTELVKDSQGRRRKKVSRVWETVSDETDAADFFIVDESGRTKVAVRGAEIIGALVVHDRFEPEKGFGDNRVLGYRKREWLIPDGANVYALGVVTDAGGELAMRKTGEDRFIVSLKSEQELVKELTGRVKAWRVLTPVLGVVGVLLIVAGFIFK